MARDQLRHVRLAIVIGVSLTIVVVGTTHNFNSGSQQVSGAAASSAPDLNSPSLGVRPDWSHPDPSTALIDGSDARAVSEQLRFAPWIVTADNQIGVSVTPTEGKAADAIWVMKDPDGTYHWIEQTQTDATPDWLVKLASESPGIESTRQLKTGEIALIATNDIAASASMIRDGVQITIMGPPETFTSDRAFEMLEQMVADNPKTPAKDSSSS